MLCWRGKSIAGHIPAVTQTCMQSQCEGGQCFSKPISLLQITQHVQHLREADLVTVHFCASIGDSQVCI